MRILASAYACEPDKGSEPGIGWNWVSQIAQHNEVWALTRTSNRKAIEQACSRGALPQVRWVYFDYPAWARFWKKGRRGVHLYYYLWQIGAYLVARRLHAQIRFDLVHHVTLGNYWMPSFMCLLPVPLIWGPVGGGEHFPPSFRRSFGMRGKVYETCRDLARWMGERDPFVRLTARRARFALATTEETAKRLRVIGCRRVSVLSQVGLPRAEIEVLQTIRQREGPPTRILSVGTLLHWKGFHLGLKAFAQLVDKHPDCEYWIIGEGPERKRLERLSRELGLQAKVRFWGVLPRSVVLRKLSDCDVLLHPALHESGGWVCVEAMAAGRPVVCLELGGPGMQVIQGTGTRVVPHDPDQTVKDLFEALYAFAIDGEHRQRVGEAAREAAMDLYSWDNKGMMAWAMYNSINDSAGG